MGTMIMVVPKRSPKSQVIKANLAQVTNNMKSLALIMEMIIMVIPTILIALQDKATTTLRTLQDKTTTTIRTQRNGQDKETAVERIMIIILTVKANPIIRIQEKPITKNIKIEGSTMAQKENHNKEAPLQVRHVNF